MERGGLVWASMALHGIKILDGHAKNWYHARPITRDVSWGSNLGHARGGTLSWPIDTIYDHLWPYMEPKLLLMKEQNSWSATPPYHYIHGKISSHPYKSGKGQGGREANHPSLGSQKWSSCSNIPLCNCHHCQCPRSTGNFNDEFWWRRWIVRLIIFSKPTLMFIWLVYCLSNLVKRISIILSKIAHSFHKKKDPNDDLTETSS